MLPVHCFVTHIYSAPRYFDERHSELPGPVEPVGVRGLSNCRVLDDLISTPLGVPLASKE